jgi:preprotein translocase SecE subunit
MNLSKYFKETQAELKEVKFPSVRQTILYTIIVVLISLFIAVLLGGSDHGLSVGLKKLLIK